MAVRYSGDAEVRIVYDPSRHEYRGSVRDPYCNYQLVAKPRALYRFSPTSPEAYDDAAITFLRLADRFSGQRLLLQKEGNGRVKVSRMFQAPCPIGPVPSVPTKRIRSRRKKRSRRDFR